MRQKSLRGAGVALIFCAALGSGCAPTVQVHGYVPSQADISRIRPANEDDAKKPRRILTIRGAGYVFAKDQDR